MYSFDCSIYLAQEVTLEIIHVKETEEAGKVIQRGDEQFKIKY